MSILIKGMEMPKNCGECKFFAWKRVVGQHCAVDDRITFHATIDGMDVAYERNGKCPLVPVPPHGLIDREQILDSIRIELAQANAVNDMEDYDAWMRVFDYVRKFPTIIPAEEGN